MDDHLRAGSSDPSCDFSPFLDEFFFLLPRARRLISFEDGPLLLLPNMIILIYYISQVRHQKSISYQINWRT